MAKELTYLVAFPGRFITAEHLEGKRVALTIDTVFQEGLDGEGKPLKLILSFVGNKMQMVLNKTNAFCLKELFGLKCSNWEKKRVVLFPTTTRFGAKTVPCIRIWGSADIDHDFPLTVPQGKNKPWVTTLHAIKAPGSVTVPVGVPDPDPTVLEAWSVLGWTKEVGHRDMAAYQGTDYLGYLSALIDKQNVATEAGAF